MLGRRILCKWNPSLARASHSLLGAHPPSLAQCCGVERSILALVLLCNYSRQFRRFSKNKQKRLALLRKGRKSVFVSVAAAQATRTQRAK